MLKNLNLNTAIAKHNTANEYEIGVTYTDKFKFEYVAIIFTPTGIVVPIKISIDCFETKPDVLIVALIKYIIP